jgi:acyl carrier protein
MLKESVVAVIARETKYPSEKISLDSSLEEFGIDSLEAISILYELEKELDIDIPNEVFANIRTVGDVVSTLEQITNDRAS